MKLRLSLFCLAVAVFTANQAEAQLAQSFGDQSSGPAAFQSVSGDLFGGRAGGGGLFGSRTGAAGQPGRVWLESNIADQGLGYEGSYLTVGAKNRLFEDRLDGRWLVEGEIHHSIADDGGLFANIGLERVFSIDAANADVSVSVWYDYDGDKQKNFSHDFHQVGASAQIKTPKWDLIGNGYFPVGIQDYTYGDLSGANCFVENSIVMIPGIDSALEGFDVTLRSRISQLAMVNGTLDIGAYSYSSEIINSFGGGRLRLGFQVLGGLIVSAEVNHDERFNTTGVLSAGWLFGANASGHGHEYSRLGRDLESVVRNDHIVRFNQDLVLATDPDTGIAYNVLHVDNTADAGVEDGTAERPFTELATAETSSTVGDVIAVHGGDGTDTGMDAGITLQNNQRLWGVGNPLLIPIADGNFFQLCADPNGIVPTISNNGGFAAVVLANNNDVAGLNIDATGATYGIFGNGNSGSIRSNIVQNAVADGVRLQSITGNWNLANNTFGNNGRDGLYIVDALDTTSNFVFDSNTATGNIFDGIHLVNYDPATISFVDNITSSNLRHGLFLENYLSTSTNPVVIQGHVANANAAKGIFIDGGSGNLRLFDSNVTGNFGAGATIRNWTTAANELILVSNTTGNTSQFSGNGPYANLEFELNTPGALSNVLVTGQTLDGGQRGLSALANGLATTININVLDNISISNNNKDGIKYSAENGGIINSRIANSTALGALQVDGNASGGGNGIHLAAIAPAGPAASASQINAEIENVFVNNAFNTIPGTPTVIIPTAGIQVDSTGNSVVDISVKDTTVGQPNQTIGGLPSRGVQFGLLFNFANLGSDLINRVNLDNIDVFADAGVTLNAGTQTYTDFVLRNSRILPRGLQSTEGTRSDNAPFADGTGVIGVNINASGLATLSGAANMQYNPNGSPTAPFEIISDGDLDNFTRVVIESNEIRDFEQQGVNVVTNGDAQLALYITGNDISNNGAGYDQDTNNNNLFNEPGDNTTVQTDQLPFFDGVNIDAFDESLITTRITGNLFRDNFEQGLSLNTFSRATINGLVANNSFFGNDRGQDANATRPPVGIGTASGPTGSISGLTNGQSDFEAINNEEFYFRPWETLVLISTGGTPAAGVPTDLGGAALPADSVGFFYPGNVGTDIFGNPVALGVANMNLDLSGNGFQLPTDIQDYAVAPGDFVLGLDGNSNSNVVNNPFFPATIGTFGSATTLIGTDETAFAGQGFLPPTH